jgi:hypothetical protein
LAELLELTSATHQHHSAVALKNRQLVDASLRRNHNRFLLRQRINANGHVSVLRAASALSDRIRITGEPPSCKGIDLLGRQLATTQAQPGDRLDAVERESFPQPLKDHSNGSS